MKALFLQQVAGEGPARFRRLLREWNVPSEVVRLWEGQPIPSLDRYDALIVLGGPMNVYETDAYPFLRDEDSAIKEALRRKLPYLGICLGAQLLAKALGAKVWPNRVKEIGHFQVEITAARRADAIFDGLPERPWVFQWHGDTFDLPPGAAHLASSPCCVQQAFRFGRAAYGLQFHVETTPALVRRWAQDYHYELSQASRDDRLVHGPWELGGARARQFRRDGSRILANFLRLVESR